MKRNLSETAPFEFEFGPKLLPEEVKYKVKMGSKGSLTVEHVQKRQLKGDSLFRFTQKVGGEDEAESILNQYKCFQNSNQSESADGILSLYIKDFNFTRRMIMEVFEIVFKELKEGVKNVLVME